MYFTYDPEAVIQDADIAAWEDQQVGQAMHAARKAGRCCHNSAVGYLPKPVYPEQEGLKPGQKRCLDGCGQVFDNDDDYVSAMREALEL